MALLNLFVLLVDSLIELICMYFCIELTLLFFFSVLVALMSFFHQHGHTRFRLRLLCSFSVDLFLICLHPSLGFCFAKYRGFVGHCEFCVLTGTSCFGQPS